MREAVSLPRGAAGQPVDGVNVTVEQLTVTTTVPELAMVLHLSDGVVTSPP